MRWLKITSLVVLGSLLVIFALMGLLFATRGTPARTVLAPGETAGPPAVRDSIFLRTIELLTHTEVSTGHRVELLLDGTGTFPAIWRDLRSARRSITLQLYYCKPGALADSLSTILRERARAGVRIRLLLDAFGAQDLPQEYLDSLRVAGVRVAQFRPLRFFSLHKAQNRSHTRIIVVDGQVGFTGGFGLADAWLGDGHRAGQWRESNVRFTGPAVAQLQAAFSTAWAEATGALLTGHEYFRAALTRPDSAGTQQAGLLFAEPSLGSTPGERFLALSLAGARRRIWIENAYFVPDDNLRRLLANAARRGVDVRVLTAGAKTDVQIVRHASHARYDNLMRAGVRIFEYQPAMLHAKTMVIDGIWSTVGTMNFDNRSLAFNDESNLLVADSIFGRALELVYLDDLRYAREFTLREFRQRPLWEKIVDAAASRMTELL